MSEKKEEVIDPTDNCCNQKPCIYYGDCAIMEAINTQNIDILDVLLTRAPGWKGEPGILLLELVSAGVKGGKLKALAFILKVKGYPIVTGFRNSEPVDYVMNDANKIKQNGAIYLLRLERSNPGYFRDNWVHIDEIISDARRA